MKHDIFDRRVSRSFSLPISLQERLDQHAGKNKVSRVVEKALIRFLDRAEASAARKAALGG